MPTAFHVSTPEHLASVDAKVRNLLADETLDVERVAVVVDAPATIDAAAGRCRENAEAVLAEGADPVICSNAARGADRIQDLPDGVEQVSSGVGELTRLQNEGCAYLRP